MPETSHKQTSCKIRSEPLEGILGKGEKGVGVFWAFRGKFWKMSKFFSSAHEIMLLNKL